MRGRLAFLALVCAAGAYGGYTYDSSGSTNWSSNGTSGFTGTGGSSLWLGTVSGNPNDYEVNTSFSSSGSGGTVAQILRASASSTELVATGGTGSYTSVEINTVNWPWATLSVNQSVNGSVTQIGSTGVRLTGSDSLRTVVCGTALWVFLNGTMVIDVTVAQTSGYAGVAGVGLDNGPYFQSHLVGHHDTAPPNAVSSNIPQQQYPAQPVFFIDHI
jgi:hypothetical protein